MADFAKIIVVDGQQVLFYHEADPDEDDKSLLHQIVEVDGMRVDVKLAGIEEEPDVFMKRLDEAAAQGLIAAVRSFMEGKLGGG